MVGDPEVPSLTLRKLNRLSRYYLPVILLSSSLMLAVALVINNIQRRYPQFWFVPVTPPGKHIAPVLETPLGEESVIIAQMDKDVQTLPLHSPHLPHLHPSHTEHPVPEKVLEV